MGSEKGFWKFFPKKFEKKENLGQGLPIIFLDKSHFTHIDNHTSKVSNARNQRSGGVGPRRSHTLRKTSSENIFGKYVPLNFISEEVLQNSPKGFGPFSIAPNVALSRSHLYISNVAPKVSHLSCPEIYISLHDRRAHPGEHIRRSSSLLYPQRFWKI